jgi:hypothetical protein
MICGCGGLLAPQTLPLGWRLRSIISLVCARMHAFGLGKCYSSDVDISDPSANPPLNLVYAVF